MKLVAQLLDCGSLHTLFFPQSHVLTFWPDFNEGTGELAVRPRAYIRNAVSQVLEEDANSTHGVTLSPFVIS